MSDPDQEPSEALAALARRTESLARRAERRRRRGTWALAALIVLQGAALVGLGVKVARDAAASVPAPDLTRLGDLEAELVALRAENARLVERVAAVLDEGVEDVRAALRDERDRSAGLLTQALADRDAARAEVVAAAARSQQDTALIGRLEEQLAAAVADRNRQVGVASRLQDELMAVRGQLDAITDRVADAPAPAEPVAAAASRPDDDAVARINDALTASGARDVRVLEVSELGGSDLRGLLVYRSDPTDAAALSAERGFLVTDADGPALRLADVRRTDEPEAPLEEFLDIPLPSIDLGAWSRAGLGVPAPLEWRSDAYDALAELLRPQGVRVATLGGFSGGVLENLVLEEVEPLGEDDEEVVVTRTFRAVRGRVVADGPTLVLEDGTIDDGGGPVPFFRGVYRMPLPGSDFGRWIVATTP